MLGNVTAASTRQWTWKLEGPAHLRPTSDSIICNISASALSLPTRRLFLLFLYEGFTRIPVRHYRALSTNHMSCWSGVDLSLLSPNTGPITSGNIMTLHPCCRNARSNGLHFSGIKHYLPCIGFKRCLREHLQTQAQIHEQELLHYGI